MSVLPCLFLRFSGISKGDSANLHLVEYVMMRVLHILQSALDLFRGMLSITADLLAG